MAQNLAQPQSARSPFVHLARIDAPVAHVMAQMRCSYKTAKKRLCEGRALLEGLTETEDTTSPEAQAAVALLRHSGATRPEISRRRWTGVALGLSRAA